MPQLGVATTATESVQNYVMDAAFDGGIPIESFHQLDGQWSHPHPRTNGLSEPSRGP